MGRVRVVLQGRGGPARVFPAALAFSVISLNCNETVGLCRFFLIFESRSADNLACHIISLFRSSVKFLSGYFKSGSLNIDFHTEILGDLLSGLDKLDLHNNTSSPALLDLINSTFTPESRNEETAPRTDAAAHGAWRRDGHATCTPFGPSTTVVMGPPDFGHRNKVSSSAGTQFSHCTKGRSSARGSLDQIPTGVLVVPEPRRTSIAAQASSGSKARNTFASISSRPSSKSCSGHYLTAYLLSRTVFPAIPPGSA